MRQHIVARLGRHRVPVEAQVARPARGHEFAARRAAVGASGDFPEAETLGVGLADRAVEGGFGLGVHQQDRRVQVVAQPVAAGRHLDRQRHDVLDPLDRRTRRGGRFLQRGAVAEEDMDIEGVEGPGVGLDGVEIGHQPHRRLRGPGRDKLVDAQAAKRVGRSLRPVRSQQAGGLGVDVEGIFVAGDAQVAVTLRVPAGQSPLRRGGEAVDAGGLGADQGDGEAAAVNLRAFAGIDVEAERDVVPQHDHGAVELGGVGGAADQHAGFEGRPAGGFGLPLAVEAATRAGGVAEARRFAGKEELLLDIAERGQIECRGPERPAARPAGNRPRQRRHPAFLPFICDMQASSNIGPRHACAGVTL